MRYRRLDEDGDMTFGAGAADFLVDSREAVAQAIRTRLDLWAGEWFLDVEEGTPWGAEVLGVGTGPTRDAAIRDRILGTPGVTAITSYSSAVSGRSFTVSATVATLYGETTVEAEL